MANVAETMSAGERAIGLDSHVANSWEGKRDDHIDKHRDADIHFSHTYIPDWFLKAVPRDRFKIAWIGHGTPEVVFSGAVRDGGPSGGPPAHGINDGLMLQQYYLSHADIIVTHWARHAAIYRTMVDRRTPIHFVPMGIDLDFWQRVPSQGKFAGEPSILCCENGYDIKWPFDLLIAWPWVYPRIPSDVSLHITRLQNDQHRWWFPLVNRNGSSYACHISNIFWDKPGLRHTFSSVDYQIGLVQKGDFNRTSLEANACGCKTISYRGNIYSDYWIDEGDQRVIADQLTDILLGRVAPRQKTKVPSHLDTARMMKVIYENA